MSPFFKKEAAIQVVCILCRKKKESVKKASITPYHIAGAFPFPLSTLEDCPLANAEDDWSCVVS